MNVPVGLLEIDFSLRYELQYVNICIMMRITVRNILTVTIISKVFNSF